MNTTSRSTRRPTGVFIGFGVAALLLAAVLSYFADSSPDGLEAVTRDGCTMVQSPDGEHLKGDCIAQSGQEHAFASSPLADYTLGGSAALTGVAGVLGVAATLLIAWGLFQALRGSRSSGSDGR